MLHGIINEQENCLDVKDDILEKKILFFTFFTCFPINKSLASGALTFGIIVIATNKPVDLFYRCFI